MTSASPSPGSSRVESSVRHGQSVEPRVFSTAEVAEIAGVSLRQLDWWDSRNVIKPLYREPRRPREYDLMGVVLCMIAERLRDAHINLTRVQKLCRSLRKDERLIKCIDSHKTLCVEHFYLLVSTTVAKIANNSDAALAIMRSHKGAFLLVAVHAFLLQIPRQRVQ